MSDIIIPLGTGSRLKNFELRMCLRGIEKHLKGYCDVWIIGEKPEFITEVHHIPFPERLTERIPDRNIFRKIQKAVDTPEITDTFIMFNDDHYLLADFEASNFPYYYSMTLEAYVKTRYKDPYGKRALNTYKALTHIENPLYYDIHYPMTIHKDKFREAFKNIEWEKSYDGYLVKSLYANQAGVDGELMRDYKSQDPPPSSAKVFSSHPHIKASVQNFLMTTYPEKSKWEKDDIGTKKK